MSDVLAKCKNGVCPKCSRGMTILCQGKPFQELYCEPCNFSYLCNGRRDKEVVAMFEGPQLQFRADPNLEVKILAE